LDAYGTHIVCELSDCRFAGHYDDLENIQTLLAKCATEAGLKSLGTHAHKFDPQGISALVILEESHMSVHLFPEIGYAAFDVYTCGQQNEGPAHVAARLFAEALGAENSKTVVLGRGRLHGNQFGIDIH
jgi:S-adenosylmethionine decarboxylase